MKNLKRHLCLPRSFPCRQNGGTSPRSAWGAPCSGRSRCLKISSIHRLAFEAFPRAFSAWWCVQGIGRVASLGGLHWKDRNGRAQSSSVHREHNCYAQSVLNANPNEPTQRNTTRNMRNSHKEQGRQAFRSLAGSVALRAPLYHPGLRTH